MKIFIIFCLIEKITSPGSFKDEEHKIDFPSITSPGSIKDEEDKIDSPLVYEYDDFENPFIDDYQSKFESSTHDNQESRQSEIQDDFYPGTVDIELKQPRRPSTLSDSHHIEISTKDFFKRLYDKALKYETDLRPDLQMGHSSQSEFQNYQPPSATESKAFTGESPTMPIIDYMHQTIHSDPATQTESIIFPHDPSHSFFHIPLYGESSQNLFGVSSQAHYGSSTNSGTQMGIPLHTIPYKASMGYSSHREFPNYPPPSDTQSKTFTDKSPTMPKIDYLHETPHNYPAIQSGPTIIPHNPIGYSFYGPSFGESSQNFFDDSSQTYPGSSTDPTTKVDMPIHSVPYEAQTDYSSQNEIPNYISQSVPKRRANTEESQTKPNIPYIHQDTHSYPTMVSQNPTSYSFDAPFYGESDQNDYVASSQPHPVSLTKPTTDFEKFVYTLPQEVSNDHSSQSEIPNYYSQTVPKRSSTTDEPPIIHSIQYIYQTPHSNPAIQSQPTTFPQNPIHPSFNAPSFGESDQNVLGLSSQPHGKSPKKSNIDFSKFVYTVPQETSTGFSFQSNFQNYQPTSDTASTAITDESQIIPNIPHIHQNPHSYSTIELDPDIFPQNPNDYSFDAPLYRESDQSVFGVSSQPHPFNPTKPTTNIGEPVYTTPLKKPRATSSQRKTPKSRPLSASKRKTTKDKSQIKLKIQHIHQNPHSYSTIQSEPILIPQNLEHYYFNASSFGESDQNLFGFSSQSQIGSQIKPTTDIGKLLYKVLHTSSGESDAEENI